MLNALQKFLITNKADKMTDKELENLMRKMDINVKFEDGLVMFMYRDNADFSDEIVKICRGIILYRESFEIACYPFNKFNNYTSFLADTIDWDSATVLEKLDGQMLKIWYNKIKNEWTVSSNSSIYLDKSLKKLFDKVSDKIDYNKLNNDKTYIFEIISQYNQIVIRYDKTELYLIGVRDNLSQLEENIDNIEIGIKKPKKYNIKSLDEAIKSINKMCKPGERYEGFVVVDKNYTRLKVKSQFYFDYKNIAGRLNGGKESILNLISTSDIEDIINKVPEMEQMIRYYDNELKNKKVYIIDLFNKCNMIKDKMFYKIDYIQEIDKLNISNKKLRNKLISYFDSHKSVEEFINSMDRKIIYSSIREWKEGM